MVHRAEEQLQGIGLATARGHRNPQGLKGFGELFCLDLHRDRIGSGRIGGLLDFGLDKGRGGLALELEQPLHFAVCSRLLGPEFKQGRRA